MKDLKNWLAEQYQELFWHKEAFQFRLRQAASEAEREKAQADYQAAQQQITQKITQKAGSFGSQKRWDELEREAYRTERMNYAYQKD